MDFFDKGALDIVKTLIKHGHKAYFAGGCVRDFLMGNNPADIDIATDATPDQIISIFKKTIPVGVQFGVVIVVIKHNQYEVATFRTDLSYKDGRHPEGIKFSSPKEDAQRRDFTINGMFYDPIKEEIIDFVEGKKDLEKKIIRAINNPHERFEEDKLRVLRAVRFSARFMFDIEKKTKQAVKEFAPKIVQVSSERIKDEIIKMFTGKNRGHALQLLEDFGILKHILPEISAMVGVEQPPQFHPEGDVFEHTKLTLDYLGDNPSATLAIAALLHDVGKPPTFRRVDRIRFNCHDTLGAKMADKILKRLKFSNKERQNIVLYIQEHMRFMNVQKMRIGRLKKMLSRDTIIEEIKLHEADCLASHGEVDNQVFCLEKLKEFSKEELKPKPLVTGHDLIALGLKPSPLFKKILENIENAQLEGEVKTKRQAISYIKTHFNKLQ